MKKKIRFYLPKSLINQAVANVKGREDLLDFEGVVEGLGLSLFDKAVQSLGGGVYTWDVRDIPNHGKTYEDGALDRLLQTVERGINSNGDIYDDGEDAWEEANDALNEIRELLR